MFAETPSVVKHVKGKKGGNATLPCGYQDKDISDGRFIRYKNTIYFSNIPACLDEEYKHENARVCKRGACDIILKDLNFSDPGIYLLRLNPVELKFYLHVHGNVQTD